MTQEISFYRARCQSVVGVTAAVDALDFLPSTLNHFSNVTHADYTIMMNIFRLSASEEKRIVPLISILTLHLNKTVIINVFI